MIEYCMNTLLQLFKPSNSLWLRFPPGLEPSGREGVPGRSFGQMKKGAENTRERMLKMAQNRNNRRIVLDSTCIRQKKHQFLDCFSPAWSVWIKAPSALDDSSSLWWSSLSCTWMSNFVCRCGFGLAFGLGSSLSRHTSSEFALLVLCRRVAKALLRVFWLEAIF